VTVGSIDTGIDASNADLAAKVHLGHGVDQAPRLGAR